MLLRRAKLPAEALADYQAAEKLLAEIFDELRDNREFRFERAKAWSNLGNLLFEHRKDPSRAGHENTQNIHWLSRVAMRRCDLRGPTQRWT